MNSELLSVILAGDWKRALALIDAGADVNFPKRALWSSIINISKEHPEFALPMLMREQDGDTLIFWTWTPLLLACERGRWEIANHLLAHGADANFTDEHGHCALMLAARAGRPDEVRALLRAGADPSHTGERGLAPLHAAAGLGGSDLVFFSVPPIGQRYSRSNEPPSPETLSTFRPILIDLINAGADVNVTAEDGSTPLILAAQEGWIDAVRELVKAGASLNAEAQFAGTPLMAALPMHLETARFLIEQGTDVNARDRWGGTPLSHTIGINMGDLRRLISHSPTNEAANSEPFSFPDFSQFQQQKPNPPPEEDLTGLQLLLDSGADPNQTIENEFGSPLICAARRDAPRAIRLLVERGADVNGRDKDGRTALMVAAYEGHPRSLLALLECGADLTLRSEKGNTALMAASLPGRPERMLSKSLEIARRPPDKEFTEAFERIEELRQKLGEHGENIPTMTQAEEHMSAFHGFLDTSIREQMKRQQSGREKALKILKGAGATE